MSNAHALHQLVTATAQRSADSVAVVDGERTLTYGELDDRSSRLSQLLLANGVRRGDRIGIHAHKSLEAVIAIYGAMKAGAAYVPLDSTAPAARTAHIVNDCGIHVMVSPSVLAARWQPLAEHGTKLEHLVALDATAADASELSTPKGIELHHGDELAAYEPATAARVISDDLSYILYTSGSTGRPKGVMVSHRNAMAFAAWATAEFGLVAADRVAQLAPLIFDLSTFDLFSSAMAGSQLHLVPSKSMMFPTQVRSFINDRQITVIYAVPSLLSMLVERGKLTPASLSSLRLVLFAGEVFTTRHLAHLMRLVPGAEFANLYGPTETNVCTFHRVEEIPDDDDPPVSIGKAIPDDEALIVGENGQLVEQGEPGELYIRGATVMQGYWGDPDRTKDLLVASPGVNGPREPAYRTGDLVREEPDGTLTFLGRRDTQIKRQGYRIELGEIEAVISRHPDVVECAVSAVDHGGGNLELVGFVATKRHVETKTILAFCAERLPRYMLPDTIENLASLPKTATNKIDRAELARRADGSTGATDT